MKTTRSKLICAMVTGLLAAGPAFAQQEAERPAERPTPAEREARRAAQLDEAFTAMDINLDEAIDIREFALAAERRIALAKQRMGERFDAARLANRPAPRETFQTLDKDGDKKLNREEFAAFRGARPAALRPGARAEGADRPERPARGEGRPERPNRPGGPAQE